MICDRAAISTQSTLDVRIPKETDQYSVLGINNNIYESLTNNDIILSYCSFQDWNIGVNSTMLASPTIVMNDTVMNSTGKISTLMDGSIALLMCDDKHKIKIPIYYLSDVYLFESVIQLLGG